VRRAEAKEACEHEDHVHLADVVEKALLDVAVKQLRGVGGVDEEARDGATPIKGPGRGPLGAEPVLLEVLDEAWEADAELGLEGCGLGGEVGPVKHGLDGGVDLGGPHTAGIVDVRDEPLVANVTKHGLLGMKFAQQYFADHAVPE
jgi:hypothetical protein